MTKTDADLRLATLEAFLRDAYERVSAAIGLIDLGDTKQAREALWVVKQDIENRKGGVR